MARKTRNSTKKASMASKASIKQQKKSKQVTKQVTKPEPQPKPEPANTNFEPLPVVAYDRYPVELDFPAKPLAEVQALEAQIMVDRRKSKMVPTENFPVKLHRLLECAEEMGFSDAICWHKSKSLLLNFLSLSSLEIIFFVLPTR